MIQTAKRQIEESPLRIDGEDNLTPEYSVQPEQVDQPSIAISNTLFKKVSPFFYRSRVRLSFTIADEYKGNFVMLRGLIEFHRPRTFNFNYSAQQRLVVADVDVEALPQLEIFLSEVLTWLKQERQFRLALKIVRDFENRYHLERESVYSILKNAVGASKQ